ncbi:hypothetical protein [Paenibacillus sp. NPDC058177]|uniref:hypothetical protein n=1 Tax=Paenibacillus sp. NPDC058177 TaxID=3346369 RepID=UPI0036DA84DD
MINKIGVKHLIGRELSDIEVQALEMLNRGDDSISETIASLILTAYRNGEKHGKSVVL